MFSPDQLKALLNTYRLNKYATASQICKNTSLKKADIDILYTDGFLDKEADKYRYNDRTVLVLEQNGFTLDEVEQDQKQTVRQPTKKEKEKLAEDLDVSVGEISLLNTVEGRRQVRYALALKKLQNGDPFDMVRLQWPELVIQDPIHLKYFAQYCERTDNLDLRLDDRQIDLIRHTFDDSITQIGIKGSTSPGKGFATAIAINLYYTSFPDSRIVLLGPSVAHSKNVMFAEVATWRKKMQYPGAGEILSQSIKDPNEEKHTLYIANPETGEGLSGAHGAHVMYVFDESSSVEEDLFINSQKQAAIIICISNPRVLSGWFYDLFPRSNPNDNQTISDKGVRRRLITFGGKDCINVKGKRLHVPIAPEGGIEIENLNGEKYFAAEYDKIPLEWRPHVEALIPGQMDYRKYTQIMSKPNPIERAWSGEGHFPPEDADLQVIPPSWLKKPCEEWGKNKDSIRVTAFGLDLAASEDKDWTVLSAGGPAGVKELYKCRKASAVQILSWLKGVFNQIGIDPFSDYYPIAIDWQGAGGHVIADLLEDNGASIVRVIPQGSAENRHLYVNKRAETYGQLGDRLNPDSEHLDTFMIPDDQDLREELVAHEKIYANDMIRYRLTPKQKIRTGADSKIQSLREILGRSPDSADAVTLCYEAILLTINDGFVAEQFNPSKIAVTAEGNEKDGYAVGFADGNTHEMNELPFGSSVSLVEMERSFEEQLRKIRTFEDIF